MNLVDHSPEVVLELGAIAGRYTESLTVNDEVLSAQEKLELEPWAYRIYVRRCVPTSAR